MNINTKSINGIIFQSIELIEDDAFDDSLNNLITPNSYIINPPSKFDNHLKNYNFVREPDLILLESKNTKKYQIPETFTIKEANYFDIPNLLNIGEENYPLWLKHETNYFENAIRCKSKKLLVITNQEGNIIGRIVGEKEKNICRIRALGLSQTNRNEGIGKGLVSSLTEYMKCDKYTVLCFSDIISFWQNIGFREVKKLKYYSKIDKNVL